MVSTKRTSLVHQFLGMMFPVVLALVLISSVWLWQGQQHWQSRQRERATELLAHQSASILSRLDMLKADLKFLSEGSLVQGLFSVPDSLQGHLQQAIKNEYDRFLRSSARYQSLKLLTHDQHPIICIQDSADAAFNSSASFLWAGKLHETLNLKLYSSNSDLRIRSAITVVDSENHSLGTVVLEFDPQLFFRDLYHWNTEQLGHFNLMNTTGQVLYRSHGDPRSQKTRFDLRGRPAQGRQLLPAGLFSWKELHTQSSLTTAVESPGGLRLLNHIPAQQYQKHWQSQLPMALLFLFLSTLLSGFFVWQLAQSRVLQKQSQQELTLLQNAMTFSPIATLILDHEDSVLFWNQAFEHYCCKDPGQHQPAEIMARILGENPGETYGEIKESIQKGQVWRKDILNKTPQGMPWWTEITCNRVMRNENQSCILFSLRDNTHRRIDEERLRVSHQEFSQLLEAISLILIEVDPMGVIRRWNPRAEQVFGLNKSQCVGRPLGNCDIDWDMKILNRLLQQSLLNPAEVRAREISFKVSNNGDTKDAYVEFSAHLIQDSGEHRGWLLLGSDTTSRRILENELQQAQKLESIGQLAAGIAHELNTPIQFISDNMLFLKDSFADLKKVLDFCLRIRTHKEAALDEKGIHELLKRMDEADLEYLLEEIPAAIEQSGEGSDRVASIVRAMKEFSHPGSAESKPVDVNKALQNTCTVARNSWKYVAELSLDLQEDLPLVPAWAAELNQVFLNIVVNAAQALQEKMGDSPAKMGSIRISSRLSGSNVEIRISDNGPGIPAEIRDRIFDPFFTTKEVGKGTGQGLNISYQVITEKHKGQLLVESRKGEGATFVIRLPLDQQKSQVKTP